MFEMKNVLSLSLFAVACFTTAFALVGCTPKPSVSVSTSVSKSVSVSVSTPAKTGS